MAYAYSNADVQERWRAELAVATELLRSGEGSLNSGDEDHSARSRSQHNKIPGVPCVGHRSTCRRQREQQRNGHPQPILFGRDNYHPGEACR